MNANTATPGDLDLLQPWFNAIRKWRSLAPQSGISVLSISLVIDARGNPLKPYPAPKVTQLEPRACAEDALADLLERLVDGNGEA